MSEIVGSELGLKSVCYLWYLWQSHEGSTFDGDVKGTTYLKELGGYDSHPLKRTLAHLENSDMSRL